MNTRPVLLTLACLLLAMPLFAQDAPAPTNDGVRPDHERPDAEARERHLHFLRRVAEIKREIDQRIAHLDIPLAREFRQLVRSEDLTFEQMRRLAELREHLSELAAPDLVAALQRLREHFAANNPDIGNDRPRPERPELTDEQKEIIRQHHAALHQAQQELNAILVAADDSGRFAELLALEERTEEEQRELASLRRELIADSEEAQAKIREIHELNVAFREAHPHAHAAPARIVRHTVHTIKRNVEAIHTLEEQIDTLLADANEEYAALIAKDELTEEEAARLAELRRELIPEVDGAADLARSIHHLRHNIREKKVRIDRIRHRLEHHHDRPDTGDTVPARGAAGGASSQGTE
jgi:hypothetical protein